MPRIEYSDGRTVEALEGESVLEASIRNGIDHLHACGGNGRCTTCRIGIIEGREFCPEPEQAEIEALALRGHDAKTRLACQLRPTGPIKVCCLLAEHPEHRPILAEGMAHESEVAVLFTDLRDFTPFAEKSLPFDVVHLLNRFFDRIGTIVEANHGHVVVFLGDGALCMFEDEDPWSSTARAVTAGLQIVEAVEVFSEYSLPEFGYATRAGVGIAFGRAVIGKIGYYNRSSDNIVGDVVNTASRIQDETKRAGVQLLVDEAVMKMTKDRFAYVECCEAELKGKSCSQKLFSIRSSGT